MPGWKRWALAQRNKLQSFAGFSPGFVLTGAKAPRGGPAFTGLKPGASTLRRALKLSSIIRVSALFVFLSAPPRLSARFRFRANGQSRLSPPALAEKLPSLYTEVLNVIRLGEDRAVQKLQRGEVTLRRFAALLILVVALAFGVIACGGGSNTTNNPFSMSITPTTYSLNYGQVMQLSPVVKNYAGNALSGQTITYTSSSPTIADVANGSTNPGAICAGTWDSETNPVICHPPTSPGTATITASASSNGGTASTTATIYVHPAIGSIAVGPTSATNTSPFTCPGSGTCTCNGTVTCPSASATACACTTSGPVSALGVSNCLSSAPTAADYALFTATVCSGPGALPGSCPNGTDITNSAGPLTWTVTPASIGIADISGITCTTGSTCKLTAALSGQAFVTASVGSVTSTPTAGGGAAALTTCPVQSISLTELASSAGSPTSSSGATGTAVSLTPTVTDSRGNPFNTLPTTLTFGSSQPLVAAASSTISSGVTGNATLVASCTPPNCNTGFYPVYSNPFLLNVTGATSTVVYVSTSSINGAYLVPISTSTTPIAAGAVITLAPSTSSFRTNSMLITPTAANIVMGSDSGGVIVYNISAGTSSVTAFSGKVLAASPDGNTIVVYDAVQGSPTVYIYSLASESVITSFPMLGTNTAHAAFSPDSGTAYIVGSNGTGSGNVLFKWTSSMSPTRLSTTGETTDAFNDVAFLPQGSFAVLAGGSNPVSVIATCHNQDVTGTPPITELPGPPPVPLATTPTVLLTVPNGSLTTANSTTASDIISSGANILAFDSPFVDDFTVSFGNSTGFSSTLNTCIPPQGLTATDQRRDFSKVAGSAASFNTDQVIVTSDGTKAFILDHSQIALLEYNVTTGIGSVIPLANSQPPTTGGATLDGLSLYVGGKDGNIHIIDLTANSGIGADTLQIPLNTTTVGAPTGFTPDFVAVTP